MLVLVEELLGVEVELLAGIIVEVLLDSCGRVVWLLVEGVDELSTMVVVEPPCVKLQLARVNIDKPKMGISIFFFIGVWFFLSYYKRYSYDNIILLKII